jgi:hypothetical protein
MLLGLTNLHAIHNSDQYANGILALAAAGIRLLAVMVGQAVHFDSQGHR